MSGFIVAPAIMTGIGLVFAVILTIAYRFLRVQEDPRVEQTEELLPGSNCGACGQAGCHAFAEQLVLGIVQPSQCTVSSAEAVEAVQAVVAVSQNQTDRATPRWLPAPVPATRASALLAVLPPAQEPAEWLLGYWTPGS